MNIQELSLTEMKDINGGAKKSVKKSIIDVVGNFNTVIGKQIGLINIGSLNIFLINFRF